MVINSRSCAWSVCYTNIHNAHLSLRWPCHRSITG